MRHVASMLICTLIYSSTFTPAYGQMLNFMMDVFSTAGRYNRIEPGGAVSGTIQGFEDFKQELRREALSTGVSATTFDGAFACLTPDLWVLEKANHQPEFVKPIWEYIEGAVSERRIELGHEAISQHANVLDAIEAAYNIDRHIVVAIWGMGSTYGHLLRDQTLVRPVIRSLAYLDPKRSKYARSQLLVALSIMQQENMAPESMIGS